MNTSLTNTISSDRQYWLTILERLARPVLSALAEGRLGRDMPVVLGPGAKEERREFAGLEAVGRLLAGIGPWLEHGPSDGDEGTLRQDLLALARRAITMGVDPESPDRLNFTSGEQCLVDASLLAEAMMRAPVQLWASLPAATQSHVLTAMKSTRVHCPMYNNHLLFAAMVETFLRHAGESWDRMRMDYALRQLDAWYAGDGVYHDGPQFHWDYYQSFVIHPFLLEITEALRGECRAWDDIADKVLVRARRATVQQALLIAPDGSYPAIGRSITYRFGAFHLLGLMASRGEYPVFLTPGSVRGALTAVIRRTMEAPDTFDPQGWLQPGLCGHQPSLSEAYINTGSLYFCALGLTPLALPVADPFWSAPPEPTPWEQRWSGTDAERDGSLEWKAALYGGTGW